MGDEIKKLVETTDEIIRINLKAYKGDIITENQMVAEIFKLINKFREL